MGGSILARMDAALAILAERNKGRAPKAFYLALPDWEAFLATGPEEIDSTWNCAPKREPGYRNVPVRLSDAPTSRLYDVATIGRPIPADPDAPTPKANDPAYHVPAEDVFAALDALSRTRALTDRESLALEAAMRGRNILTVREAVRLGLKRKAVA